MPCTAPGICRWYAGGRVAGDGSVGTLNGGKPLAGGFALSLDLYRATSDHLPAWLKGWGLSLDYSHQWHAQGSNDRFGVAYHRWTYHSVLDGYVGPTFIRDRPAGADLGTYGVGGTAGFILRIGSIDAGKTHVVPFLGVQMTLGAQWGAGETEFLGDGQVVFGLQLWSPPFGGEAD